VKICFLSSAHPPLDKRVFEKEARSLVSEGFDVVHIAPGERFEVWTQNNVRIVTFPRTRGLSGRLLSLARLYRLAAREAASCYHCNEVDSWLVGVCLKATRRAAVVFDVHEHYPSDLAERCRPRWAEKIAEMLLQRIFRVLTPRTDRLVFAKKFIADDFVMEPDRQVLVENFASLLHRDRGTHAHQSRGESMVLVIHSGLMARSRGWPQLLDALARTRCQAVSLKLVGAFADGSQGDFEKRVETLGLAARVTCVDWMPFAAAYDEVLGADIGIVAFQPGVYNHTVALPHKMFDYMLAGLPVVVPYFAREVAEIVRETDCGVLIDSANPAAIGDALDRLAGDPDERRRLGANGRRAVLERYNWEQEARRLIAMYRGLETGTVPSATGHR
jgi:glycosyltransferase involved in cell wall biosynthesis